MEWPTGKYDVIYADPPWRMKNTKTGGSMKSGAAQKYSVMNMRDLCALPVNDLCNKNAVLFMWWLAAMPEQALQLVDAWGFKLKTMTGFVWNKTTVKGTPHFGMGFYTRAGSESCLIAVKGKWKPSSHSVRSVVTEPVRGHSKKPMGVARGIEELSGDVPRIELFARDIKPGWDVWGNEVEVALTWAK